MDIRIDFVPGTTDIASSVVFRTARKLFDGTVFPRTA
jgi:hypothetical protein